jgi:DNA-directed RNA polymerase specialized sigma24 family protein
MADVLGIPEKTVKSRLFSARQQLKDILSARGVTR